MTIENNFKKKLLVHEISFKLKKIYLTFVIYGNIKLKEPHTFTTGVFLLN